MREVRAILAVMFMALFMMGISAIVVGNVHFGTTTVMAQDDEGWDDWDDEGEEEDAFGNIMETTFAAISDITVGAAAAGAPVSVTAKVTLEDEEEEATLSSVVLSYSVNGSTVASVDMTDNGDGSYTGSIPGQNSGAVVSYYVTATDSNGNITTGAVAGAGNLVSAVPDMDNSEDIVGDDTDILNLSAGFDDTYLYVNFDVQGKIAGGTLDPPYIQLYGVKITNPDTDQGEGLMVGKLWVYLPLAKDKEVQEKFMPLLMQSGQEFIEKIGQDKIDHVMNTGMLVLDIGKLMGGNIMDGILFDAEPNADTEGGSFAGRIRRAPLGENPSGLLRIIVLTAANASIDSFMPIPLNCSNFITVDTANRSYTVK